MLDEQKDVTPDSSAVPVSEDVKTPDAVEGKAEVVSEPQKPPQGYVAWQVLERERAKRKQLEEELNQLKSSASSEEPEEYLSDEANELKGKVSSLEERISSFEERQELREFQSLYPPLKDKAEEFDEFRKEYPRTSLAKVAKLFLVENGLLEVPEPRKGLEKPTGGQKTAAPPGLTSEEVKRIRLNEPKRYLKLLREGKLNPDDIKE